MSSSSSTGRSAIRRAGMSAATSTLRRRTMPISTTRVAGGRVEARVGRRQPGLLELVHQLGQRLLVVDPAEELPDRVEVLDVVDQRRAGQRHQQRPRGARPDPLGEVEDVLGALGLLVLDEVRLVDDHRAEPEVAEPPDVPVEDLVVDDHDVGEAVDVVAVAVDHGDRAVGRPDAGLAGPVGLDDVGDDGQQREGVGGLRGEQRLGGLAEAGLVGQQVGAVTLGGGLDQLGLVAHQLERRRAPGCRWARAAACTRPAAAVLEGAEQRAEQLPGRQPARLGAAVLGGGEVGDEERVGELALDDRLRHDPPVGHGEQLGLVGLGLLLLLELHAGGRDHLAAQLLGRVGDAGVLGEQARAAWCRWRRSWPGSWPRRRAA